MKLKMIVLYILILTIILVMAYIRFAPSKYAVWVLDPVSASSTGKPNEYRLTGNTAPVFHMPTQDLFKLVGGFILSQKRVHLLAENTNTFEATYVQRSLLMGYPDYISIKITAVNANQSRLEVFSRSRFGHSDLGVNKRRIDQWISAIRGLVAR